MPVNASGMSNRVREPSKYSASWRAAAATARASGRSVWSAPIGAGAPGASAFGRSRPVRASSVSLEDEPPDRRLEREPTDRGGGEVGRAGRSECGAHAALTCLSVGDTAFGRAEGAVEFQRWATAYARHGRQRSASRLERDGVARLAEVGDRAAHAEVGLEEGVGVAEHAHRDIVRRPRTDPVELEQAGAEHVRVRAGVDLEVAGGDGLRPGRRACGGATAGIGNAAGSSAARLASASGVGKACVIGRTGSGIGSPAARTRAPSTVRAPADGDLLADDGTHGQLEAVGRAGNAEPGRACDERPEQRIRAEESGRRRRGRRRGSGGGGSGRSRPSDRAGRRARTRPSTYPPSPPALSATVPRPLGRRRLRRYVTPSNASMPATAREPRK